MAEPQPENVQEGADPPDVLPANQEDRKAAKAMSSLDAHGDEDDGKPKNQVDMKALSDAISNLEKKPASSASAGVAGAGAAGKKDEPKKLIKVDPADVTLVMEQLDISKAKATDLLRAKDGNVVETMTAWVTAAA